MIKLASGTVHKIPLDFASAISADKTSKELWNMISPIARNEWICWVESAKKEKTRIRRIAVGISKMQSGTRRPCCWAGCVHRTDKPLSKSQRYFLSK